jgi:hypothetical protein
MQLLLLLLLLSPLLQRSSICCLFPIAVVWSGYCIVLSISLVWHGAAAATAWVEAAAEHPQYHHHRRQRKQLNEDSDIMRGGPQLRSKTYQKEDHLNERRTPRRKHSDTMMTTRMRMMRMMMQRTGSTIRWCLRACQNGGICQFRYDFTNTNLEQEVCECLVGWVGDFCEEAAKEKGDEQDRTGNRPPRPIQSMPLGGETTTPSPTVSPSRSAFPTTRSCQLDCGEHGVCNLDMVMNDDNGSSGTHTQYQERCYCQVGYVGEFCDQALASVETTTSLPPTLSPNGSVWPTKPAPLQHLHANWIVENTVFVSSTPRFLEVVVRMRAVSA